MSEVQMSDANLSTLDRNILDAINKGFNYASDVLDYCGPRYADTDGMDSAAYLDEVDNLIDRGYVKQKGKRFGGQIVLELTDKGRESAPSLSDAEQSLVDEHDILLDSLGVLKDVIELEDADGSLPSISRLQKYDDRDASAYQYTLHFNRLTQAGLASEKGIFRYRVKPTDGGRSLVDEYESQGHI